MQSYPRDVRKFAVSFPLGVHTTSPVVHEMYVRAHTSSNQVSSSCGAKSFLKRPWAWKLLPGYIGIVDWLEGVFCYDPLQTITTLVVKAARERSQEVARQRGDLDCSCWCGFARRWGQLLETVQSKLRP